MANDIDLDCHPVLQTSSEMHHRNSPKSIHKTSNPNHGETMEIREVDSEDQGCELDDDFLDKFDNLQVSVDKQISCCSFDEGYRSKSMTMSLEENSLDILKRHPVQESYGVGQLSVKVPSSEAIDVFSRNEDGDTDLHLAVIHGEAEKTRHFISIAPNQEWLNLINYLFQTPLHLAVITRQCDIVRCLMAAGACVSVRDLQGNTPLHIACREGFDEIVRCLLRPVYYEEIQQNKYEIPYQRIPQNLEIRNYDGHTCLHLAAQGTHLKALGLLLSKGAKINVRDAKSGRTVLHCAAETGNCVLVNFLLKQRKIDINSVTYGGWTPVSLAAGRGYGDVVHTLFLHGASCSDLYATDESEDDDD